MRLFDALLTITFILQLIGCTPPNPPDPAPRPILLPTPTSPEGVPSVPKTPHGASLGAIPTPTPPYLSRSEILALLKASTVKSMGLVQSDPKLTKEAKEHEKNLIPPSDFLPPAELKKLDASLQKSFVLGGVPNGAPLEVDLRLRDTAPKSQDNGKCTAYALTAAMESLLQSQGPVPGLDLSDWHTWSYYRQYSAIAAIKALSKPSATVTDEKYYPQFGSLKKGVSGLYGPITSKYLGDDSGAMVQSLIDGHPVYLALSTPKQMLACNKIINQGAASRGGHAVLIVGYILDEKGAPYAIIKNSWGAKCGDHGYQYMAMALCKKKGYYCSMWAIESVVQSK